MPRSTKTRSQALRERVGEIEPPPMRLVVKGGFLGYQETPVDKEHPLPEPVTLRGIGRSLVNLVTRKGI